MLWTKEDTDRILRDIMARSQHDAAFRQLCLQDAGAAVTEVCGHDLPKGFTLRFVDNAGAALTLVLPDPIAAHELSDDELAGVSGGAGMEASAPKSGWVQLQNIRLKEG